MNFHDVLFPVDIAQGAVGGPRYRTTVVTTASGFERRFQEWDEAAYRWTIDLGVWSPDRLEALANFFHARAGSAFAFRFRDPFDHWAGMSWATGALEYPAAAASALLFGTGNGSQTAFQLTKTYLSGPVSRVRRITRPVAGSVRVWVGPTPLVEGTGFTLNASTGVVTLATAPSSGAPVRWAGLFDVPARFEGDQMELTGLSVGSGDWRSVSIVGVRE